MGEPSRGQDVQIEMFNNGVPIGIINAQDATVNMDSDEERQTRLGTRLETPRQKFHGFSGTLTFEEESPVLDDLVDAITTRYFAEQPVQRFDIVITRYYPETGLTRTYAYLDCVMKVNTSITGKNDENESSVEWMSADRELISV